MGGRDHSYECETCGLYRGGLNDLRCDCDPCKDCGEVGEPCRCVRTLVVLDVVSTLLGNLAVAGALQLAFDLGLYNTECANVHPSVNWPPGCGKAAT